MKLLKYIFFLQRYLIKIYLNKNIKSKNFVRIQKNVKIIVEKDAFIFFGNKVVIKHDTVLYAKKGAKISIGNNTSTGHHSEITAGKNIVIGNNVIMGAYTYITDSNHEYGNVKVPIKDQGMSIGDTVIGDNIWLGRGVMILKDSEIRSNSIVAASSVVTKKFDDNCIIGGVPAKLIKKNLVNE